MKLSVIIPVFNEKNTIQKILQLIENQNFIEKQLVIVDDCSSDETLIQIENFNFLSEKILLKHDKNLGKGACIKTAKAHADGDIILIQDADLEYDPNDYKKLIEPIINNEANVVYGSRVKGKNRYRNNKFTSILRIFVNHGLTILSNIINKQILTDAHTCYKVFKKDVFDKINLVEDDFAFCPEVTSKVSNLKEKIIEIPINYRGRDYKEGKKIRIKDGFLALRAIFLYGFLYKFKKN